LVALYNEHLAATQQQQQQQQQQQPTTVSSVQFSQQASLDCQSNSVVLHTECINLIAATRLLTASNVQLSSRLVESRDLSLAQLKVKLAESRARLKRLTSANRRAMIELQRKEAAMCSILLVEKTRLAEQLSTHATMNGKLQSELDRFVTHPNGVLSYRYT
jgi:flagellar motor switch/type III secretory pathway protein FliN